MTGLLEVFHRGQRGGAIRELESGGVEFAYRGPGPALSGPFPSVSLTGGFRAWLEKVVIAADASAFERPAAQLIPGFQRW